MNYVHFVRSGLPLGYALSILSARASPLVPEHAVRLTPVQHRATIYSLYKVTSLTYRRICGRLHVGLCKGANVRDFCEAA